MYVHFNRVEIVDGNVFRTKYMDTVFMSKKKESRKIKIRANEPIAVFRASFCSF